MRRKRQPLYHLLLRVKPKTKRIPRQLGEICISVSGLTDRNVPNVTTVVYCHNESPRSRMEKLEGISQHDLTNLFLLF